MTVRRVVALRIADLPVPNAPSNEARCARCGEAVWLSVATEADMLPGDSIVCRVCFPRETAGERDVDVVVGPNTRRAVEAWRKEQGWTQR